MRYMRYMRYQNTSDDNETPQEEVDRLLRDL